MGSGSCLFHLDEPKQCTIYILYLSRIVANIVQLRYLTFSISFNLLGMRVFLFVHKKVFQVIVNENLSVLYWDFSTCFEHLFAILVLAMFVLVIDF